MAKNNEKIWRWARMALTVGTILVAAAVAYATLRERVNTNRGRLDTVEVKADSNQIAIIEIKADLTYIKSGIDEIKEAQKLRK